MGWGDARFPAVVLSTAPVMFGRVVGVYIATLFMIWQFIRFAAFRTLRLAGRRSRDRGGTDRHFLAHRLKFDAPV